VLDPKLLRSDLVRSGPPNWRAGNFKFDVARLRHWRSSARRFKSSRIACGRSAMPVRKRWGRQRPRGGCRTPLARGEALGAELQALEKQLDEVQAELHSFRSD